MRNKTQFFSQKVISHLSNTLASIFCYILNNRSNYFEIPVCIRSPYLGVIAKLSSFFFCCCCCFSGNFLLLLNYLPQLPKYSIERNMGKRYHDLTHASTRPVKYLKLSTFTYFREAFLGVRCDPTTGHGCPDGVQFEKVRVYHKRLYTALHV